MAKLKVVVLKGLPASGKSRRAYELAKEGFYRTNKDDIRAMLYGDNYKQKHEKQVIWTRDAMIHAALGHNKSVVVDDTNFNPVHLRAIKKIAQQYKAEVEVDDSFLEVPLEICIERDSKREKTVGEKVIRDMFTKNILLPKIKQQWEGDLPVAIWCDIDGTLTNGIKDRSPYDWKKVGNDEPNEATVHLLDAIQEIGYAKIFLMSGRDSVCRPETEAWLEHHMIPYDFLYMREKDDNRKDTIVKRELYDQYIKGKYRVLFALDDRPAVVNMLRDELGLMVYAIGDQRNEF